METNRTNGSAPQKDANGRFTSKSSTPCNAKCLLPTLNGETHSSDFKAHTGDINAKGMESNADGRKELLYMIIDDYKEICSSQGKRLNEQFREIVKMSKELRKAEKEIFALKYPKQEESYKGKLVKLPAKI